jgi:transposase-like protein
MSRKSATVCRMHDFSSYFSGLNQLTMLKVSRYCFAQWLYLYRAVDKFGDTIDFMLSEQRDEMAAIAFFKQVINNNGC